MFYSVRNGNKKFLGETQGDLLTFEIVFVKKKKNMGVRKCDVEGCNSVSTKTEDRGVTFHQFPSNVETRTRWASQCRIDLSKYTKLMHVCSRHFMKANFQLFRGKKYVLKQGSVPTLFPWGITPLPGDTETQTPSSIKEGTAAIEEDENDSSAEGDETMEDSSTVVTEKSAKDMVPPLIEKIKKDLKAPVKRSASAEDGTGRSEPRKKILRKSSDSAFIKSPNKRAASKRLAAAAASSKKTTEIKTEPSQATPVAATINFTPGTVIEAQDFNEVWHSAKIMEVDHDDREALINFEKTSKGKPPG